MADTEQKIEEISELEGEKKERRQKFLIYHSRVKTKINFRPEKNLSSELKKIIFGTNLNLTAFKISVKGETITDPNITLGQFVEKHGCYEVSLEKIDTGLDLSPTRLIPRSPESPMRMAFSAESPRMESPTRLIRVGRQLSASSPGLSSSPGSPSGLTRRKSVFSRMYAEGSDGDQASDDLMLRSASAPASESELNDLRRLLIRRGSSFMPPQEEFLEASTSPTEEKQSEDWLLADEDPISMQQHLVEAKTVRHFDDLSSFVFSDGLLCTGKPRDFFLRLFHGGDSEYTEAYLSCHHYFMDPMELLKQLIVFYRAPPVSSSLRQKFQDKVIQLISEWIRYQRHLSDNQDIINLYNRFLTHIETNNQEHFKTLKKKWRNATYEALIEVPSLKTKKNFAQNQMTDITASDPTMVARQMTLMEQCVFHQVPVSEFYNLSWTKPKTPPNLALLMEQSEVVPRWVATTILDPVELSIKDRAKRISFWAKVMQELVDIGNFNSAIQIFTTLNLPIIDKLKCWKLVSKSSLDVLPVVQSLIDSNFKQYRSRLNNEFAGKPVLPIYSVFLKDLTMIEEIPTFEEEKLSWDKISLLSNVFALIRSTQTRSYHFKEDAATLQALFFRVVLDNEKLEELSKQVRSSEERGTVSGEFGKPRSGSSNRQIFTLPRSRSSSKSNIFSSNIEFSDLPRDSLLYKQFRTHLGDEKAILLDLFKCLISFENHIEWSEENMTLVAEGICDQYLGFGDTPAVLNLPPQTLQLLTSNREKPTPKLFVAVKMAVLREIEHVFKEFMRTKSEKDKEALRESCG